MTEKAEYVLEKHLYDKHSAMVVHGHLSYWEGFHQIQNWKKGVQIGFGNIDIERYVSNVFSFKIEFTLNNLDCRSIQAHF